MLLTRKELFPSRDINDCFDRKKEVRKSCKPVIYTFKDGEWNGADMILLSVTIEAVNVFTFALKHYMKHKKSAG